MSGLTGKRMSPNTPIIEQEPAGLFVTQSVTSNELTNPKTEDDQAMKTGETRRPGTIYKAYMALMGWAIVMYAPEGASVIETGIKSLTQAQKRVAYWTKQEAKANKRAEGAA